MIGGGREGGREVVCCRLAAGDGSQWMLKWLKSGIKFELTSIRIVAIFFC